MLNRDNMSLIKNRRIESLKEIIRELLAIVKIKNARIEELENELALSRREIHRYKNSGKVITKPTKSSRTRRKKNVFE